MPVDAGLAWGEQDVMMTGFNAAGYWIEASADGTNWGNPEAVVTAVRSRLQDGSLASVTSEDNRQAPVQLRVRGEHYDGLVAGEEALVAETRREGYNTLTYTPPVDDAVASVFDVVYSVLDYSLVDLNEKRLERQYTATLTCLPFPRADTETVATAPLPPPSTPVATSVDDGSSTSGWTGSTTVSTSGSALSVAATTTTAASVKWLQRAGSVSMTTTPYLFVDWIWGSANGARVLNSFTAIVDGITYTPVASGPSPTAPFIRTYFQVPSFSTVRFVADISEVQGGFGPGPSPSNFSLTQVTKTDALPGAGTRRQLTRTLPVAGSVRTQGRLSMQHESTALGDALIYVYKDDGSGYVPAARPYRAGGGSVTTDTAIYSGSYDNLNTATYFDFPVLALPSGNYEVMARLQRPTAATVGLSLTATTRVNSTTLSTRSSAPSVAVPDAYGFCHIDYLTLSTTKLASPASGTVRVTIEDPTDSNIRLDDLYLLNLDIGTVTIVSCGTGTPASGGSANRLWLDPATMTNDGQPAIFIGYAADRSDAYDPGTAIKAWTPPLFEPTSMNLFTACNALDAAVTLSHFRRGLHHIRALAA